MSGLGHGVRSLTHAHGAHWQATGAKESSLIVSISATFMLDADALSRKGFHRFLRFDASGLHVTMSSPHLKAVLFDVRLSSHHATVMDV